MLNLEKLINSCDLAIKGGNLLAVKGYLSQLNTARVPRKWRLPLANICRRAGLPAEGLRLLARIVYPGGKKASAIATSAELTEYAALLIRSDSYGEAQAVLKKVNFAEASEAHLIRAFVHFSQFEYHQAVPLLESYCKSDIADYARLVGKVNLALALVSSGQEHLADQCINDIYAKVAETGKKRLQANCHAVKAQSRFQNGDFAAALSEAELGMSIFNSTNSSDKILLLRWQAFAKGRLESSMQPLTEFRQIAVNSSEFDDIREADLQILNMSFNESLFHHLIFGSPYPEFRNRVYKSIGHRLKSEFYKFGENDSPCLDLISGSTNQKQIFKPGSTSYQLLSVLLADLYRPNKIRGLFSKLYPNEHFDVGTSPDRIHQALRRLRMTLQDEKIPVSILETDGIYRLQIDGSFAFQLPLENQPVDSMGFHLKCLSTLDGGFTARDAQTKLGLSKTMVHLILQNGVESGKLQREGNTNRTITYKIAS